jgi:micrococcal nuclease
MRCSRLAFIFILLGIPATCFSWPAKVVSVADGDTIIVLHLDRQKEIRLYGIDCPEKDQDHGQQAKAITAALVAGRNVEIEQKEIDRYGRVVGLVKVDGQSLNEMIIQNGYAWVYPQNCKEKFCSDWVRLEGAARQQRKGMWSDSVVVPPWEWRAAKRESKAEEETTPIIIIGGSNPVGERSSGGQYKCDGRTYCSQMTSCQEATFFLKNCPGTKMDGNNDGVPCEKQWCH